MMRAEMDKLNREGVKARGSYLNRWKIGDPLAPEVRSERKWLQQGQVVQQRWTLLLNVIGYQDLTLCAWNWKKLPEEASPQIMLTNVKYLKTK